MSQKVGAKTKGFIENLTTLQTMKFQFNPEAFQYSRGATYSEIVSPGMSYPSLQYVHGNARSFSVELFFFDKPCTGLIDTYREFFEELLPPEDNPPDFKKPPKMFFCYGYFLKVCVLEELSVVDEEFDDKSGKPVMSRMTLTLRQVSA